MCHADVLQAWLEGLGLAPDGGQEVGLVGLLHRARRSEQREDRMPLDVVAQRVPEDLGQCVTAMAVQGAGVPTSTSSISRYADCPAGDIVAGPDLRPYQLPGRGRESWHGHKIRAASGSEEVST